MIAESDDTLWNEAMDLLRHHHQKPSDRTPVDALNRLFHEAAPKAKSIQLGETNCRVVSESWSTNKLADLCRRHNRATPNQEDRPILVVKWCCKHYLIDGANRINKWFKEKNADSHAVLAVVLVGGGAG